MPTSETFKKTGWIRVDDGLPEELTFVLAYAPYHADPFLAYYDGVNTGWFRTDWEDNHYPVNVSTWHALPELPEESE